MADQVRNIISVNVGTEVPNPQLFIRAGLAANYHQLNQILHSIPNYDPNQCYFYLSIKSSNPEHLRQQIIDFLDVATQTMKEMDPELEQMIGNSKFNVTTNGEQVIISINLLENEFARQYADLVNKFGFDHIKSELKLDAQLTSNEPFNFFLSVKQRQDLNKVKGGFALEVTSTKADKWALKSQFLNWMEEDDGPYEDDEERLMGLLFLMFSAANFKLSSIQDVNLGDALGEDIFLAYMDFLHEILYEFRDVYAEQKEMMDEFPFVQAFFDALEQHGHGVISIGFAYQQLSAHVDAQVNNFKEVYKIISTPNNEDD